MTDTSRQLTDDQAQLIAAALRLSTAMNTPRPYFYVNRSKTKVTLRLVRTRKVPVARCEAGDKYYVYRSHKLTPLGRRMLKLVADREGYESARIAGNEQAERMVMA
ncbi:MAG: hypothetical protein H0U60_18620 [Blastocatellia bacterium]|nr:hypothetical protein [Blastocatellia bacterium]